MSGRTAQKWLNRFLRYRGLTLTTTVALFSGWVLLAGFLLGQVKVKEEFSCLASLDMLTGPGPGQGADEQRIRARIFEGLSRNVFTSLRPGDEIELRTTEPRGQPIYLRGRLIALDGENNLPSLLLRPEKSGENDLKAYRAVSGEQPARLRVGIRNKRLLQVAFERSPLPR